MSRVRFSHIIISVITAVLVGLFVTIYVFHSTLLDIERSLPIVETEQERDLTSLYQEFTVLAKAITMAKSEPSEPHLKAARNAAQKVDKRLKQLRSKYNFDNLIGASAIHAIVSPAVFDIEQWLQAGIYDYPPSSPAVLNLLNRRADSALTKFAHQLTSTRETATATLRDQGVRIRHLHWVIIALLGFISAMIVVLIGLVVRHQKTQRDLELAKELAERANQSKSEFLASMSHDLRTPLNAIIGFSEILRNTLFGPLGDRRYEEYAKDIHDSGSLLLNLIDDILDISKVEAGKYKLSDTELDIAGLLRTCFRQLAPSAEAARLTLLAEIPSDFPALRGDERTLIQILNNLLSNATKFTPEGGKITVSAKLDKSTGIVLAVSDTGVGMTESDLAKVRQPFEQAHLTASEHPKGTGLGLYLSAKFMKLFGGSLGIESEPDKGTTITLRFPPDRTIRATAP